MEHIIQVKLNWELHTNLSSALITRFPANERGETDEAYNVSTTVCFVVALIKYPDQRFSVPER